MNSINKHFLNCSKLIDGYYLDNYSFFKLCYHSCKTCNISGNDINHNCIQCKAEYQFEIIYEPYKNCYNKCPENNKYEFKKKCYDNCPFDFKVRENDPKLLIFNLDYRYFCRPNCTKDYPYEILYEQKCVKFCEYKYLKDKSRLLNYIEEKEKTEIEPGYKKISKREEQIKMYNIILDNTELSFTSESFNTSELEGGENVIFEFEEMKILLTTTKNQEDDNENHIRIQT